MPGEGVAMTAEHTGGIDVKCNKCGATSTMAWQPGAACPECASTEVEPVTKIDVGGGPAMPPVQAAPQGQRQNPLVAVILVTVIVVALGFFIKNLLPEKTVRHDVFWLCEDCAAEFPGKPAVGPVECVACAGQAVRLLKYECLEHDHVFNALLIKPEAESYAKYLKKMEELTAADAHSDDARRPMAPMMGPDMYTTLYSLPDGEWSEGYPKEICCPQGNCDKKKLRYFRPQ